MKTKFFVIVTLVISSISTAVFAQSPRENSIVKNVVLAEGTNTVDFGRVGKMYITRRSGKTVTVRVQKGNNLKQISLANNGGTNGGSDCECGIIVYTEGWQECKQCDPTPLPPTPSGDLTRIVWKLDENNNPNAGL
jgi:hypothetical protein